MGLINADWVKQGVIRIGCLINTMEKLNLVTLSRDDMCKWCGPNYHRTILFDQEGQDRLGELIACHQPLMVARLGAVELSCLRFYLEKRSNKTSTFSSKIKKSMQNNAGFFPTNDQSLDAFSELYLDCLKQVDLMAVWFNNYEHVICNTYCNKAELIYLDCLEPFQFTNPWSRNLSGKKVLVVHPFTESIRSQYSKKRHLLFADPNVLPDFELHTIKAVQSLAGMKVDFATWFDAYRYMCDDVARTDFDICLIGAGAYGLPLASFAKSLGKQAIHMGGVTQILFGIKGKRWEEDHLYKKSTAKLFNDHWVRPSMSETPPHKNRVENGCYW